LENLITLHLDMLAHEQGFKTSSTEKKPHAF
jgi:hypothetical protein